MGIISITELITVVCLVTIGTSILIALPTIVSFLRLKKKQLKYQMENKNSIEYFNKRISTNDVLLQFIRTTIASVSVLRFRTFKDKHDFSKVTKANIESLAKEVAIEVNECLKLDQSDILEYTILSKDFYDNYIINTSFAMIKDLFEKRIESITYDEE